MTHPDPLSTAPAPTLRFEPDQDIDELRHDYDRLVERVAMINGWIDQLNAAPGLLTEAGEAEATAMHGELMEMLGERAFARDECENAIARHRDAA